MRFSSHRSSSTFNTGMLEAARVNPGLRRRVASSRPRRCGIETTRGADIFGSSSNVTACNSTLSGKKRAANNRRGNPRELSVFPFVFPANGSATGADCRAGRRCYMSLGTIILIILVIALLGGFSGIGGGPFYGTGYYGGGGLRPIIVILLILVLLGKL